MVVQGFELNPDPLQRRNGKGPTGGGRDVLERTAAEAAAKVGRENVGAGVAVTWATVKEALDQVRGALTIVYPKGVPPYEPVRMELENREELAGSQASKEVRFFSLNSMIPLAFLLCTFLKLTACGSNLRFQ